MNRCWIRRLCESSSMVRWITLDGDDDKSKREFFFPNILHAFAWVFIRWVSHTNREVIPSFALCERKHASIFSPLNMRFEAHKKTNRIKNIMTIVIDEQIINIYVTHDSNNDDDDIIIRFRCIRIFSSFYRTHLIRIHAMYYNFFDRLFAAG